MNVLLDPEVWDVDKIELLLSQNFNIKGNYMVRDTALCVERISTDTEGTWFFEMELKDGHPMTKKQFPTFLNLLEFLTA